MAPRIFRRKGDDSVSVDDVPDAPEVEVDIGAEPDQPTGPGVRVLIVPILVVALVAVLSVGSLMAAFRSFRPHSVPVAVAADAQSVEFFAKQLGSGPDPIFDIQAVPAGQTPASLVKSRQVYATLVLGQKAWQLQYAGANGTIINSQLTGAFQPAGAKIAYRTIDLAPSAKGDRSGWSVFCLVLGIVLAGFGFGLVLGFRRTRLPRRTELLGLALFAALAGVVSTLVVRYAFDALIGNPFVPCILQSLLAFVVAGLTTAFVRVGRLYGAALAGLFFVAVGTALSGSLLPAPYLSTAWQPLVNFVPNGQAAQGTTGASYFGGASFGIGLYGLLSWTIVTLVALALVRRFFPYDAADEQSTATAS